jgi:hypothetical protein
MFSGFVTNYHREKLGPEFSLFVQGKGSVHVRVFDVARMNACPMYLAVKKERVAMQRITRASRNWARVDKENPTLVPMTA